MNSYHYRPVPVQIYDLAALHARGHARRRTVVPKTWGDVAERGGGGRFIALLQSELDAIRRLTR